MKKEDILRLLKEHSSDLGKFSVSAIAIFGSAARDELRPESDIDILVEFAQPVGLFQFVRLKMHLEAMLGKTVDLVTMPALKEQLKPAILKEAIYA